MIPRFPLEYVDEEGTSHVLADDRAVEETVEFLDDVDPPYRCVDADGRRVRLILWNLQLLVCQLVPDDFAPAGIEIRHDAEDRIAESYGGVPLRAIAGEGIAEPADWRQPVRAVTDGGTDARLTPAQFHDRWMRARLGRWP